MWNKKMLIDSKTYILLKNTERFKLLKIKFLDKDILVPDSASFLFLIKEIFEREIYKFYQQKDKA